MGPELVLLTARLCVLMAKARVALPSPASPRLDHPQSPLQPPGHGSPPTPTHPYSLFPSNLFFKARHPLEWAHPEILWIQRKNLISFINCHLRLSRGHTSAFRFPRESEALRRVHSQVPLHPAPGDLRGLALPSSF